MKQDKKYLGINQPIPYKVLDEVHYHYFNNKLLTKEEILNLLKEYISGENRLGKALSHISQIQTINSEVLSKLKVHLGVENYLKLSESDRLCLTVCLVSLTFPVAYDLLNILSIGFKVQNKINRNYINQKMSAQYGSNRGIYNAVDALMLMLIEFELIKRDKNGVYEFGTTKKIVNKNLNDLYIYADIRLSGSKSILVEDIEYRPWYIYFKPRYKRFETSFLIKMIESRIGQGYLTT